MHIVAFFSCRNTRWEDAAKIGNANFNRESNNSQQKRIKKNGLDDNTGLAKDQASPWWWHMSITLALKRLREEELEFRASLVCTRLSEK